MANDKLQEVTSIGQLKALAKELGVRDDWHEPDEQEVDAVVHGNTFDNAGFEYEKHVIIKKDGEPVARINLATLLAFACDKYKGFDHFHEGTTVRLKKSVKRHHTCPEGRECHKTAKIRKFLSEYSSGAVVLDRDLEGGMYWNTEDLEVVWR